MEKLLTTNELAKFLDVAPYTIYLLRQTGQGPRYLKLGRIIRYKMEDVQTWLEEKTKEKEYPGYWSILLDIQIFLAIVVCAETKRCKNGNKMDMWKTII